MAPFHEAILVRRSSTGVYAGVVDPEWTVGAVPHGGYVLALLVDACMQYQSQSNTGHRDPLHVTAHFLRSTAVSPFEIQVQTLKTGRGFTNITAELVQRGQTKITAHLIFGINAPSSDSPFILPSSYTRRIPLYTHPSNAVILSSQKVWNFHSKVKWTREPEIHARNQLNSPTRSHSNTIGGDGLEWGAWFEILGDDSARITSPSLAFLVDIFVNMPMLLPRSQRGDIDNSWCPTMTLSMEFKSPIPEPSKYHASRTVGVYSSGKFISEPQGRHEGYVEIWTAPCNLGEGAEIEGWREHQVCLAMATQMALMVPMEVNLGRSAKESSKL